MYNVMCSRYLTSLYIIITLILGRLFRLVGLSFSHFTFLYHIKSLIVMNEVIRLCVFRHLLLMFIIFFLYSFLSHVRSARWYRSINISCKCLNNDVCLIVFCQ